MDRGIALWAALAAALSGCVLEARGRPGADAGAGAGGDAAEDSGASAFAERQGLSPGEQGARLQPNPPEPVQPFSFRRRISLDAGDPGAAGGLPVPIVLEPAVFDYGSARPDGSDIRFFDADGEPLPCEVEAWRPGERSLLWVRAPELAPQGEDFFWMYYGAREEIAPPPEPGAVWSGYQNVYHLTTAGDSGPQGFDAAAEGGTPIAGVLGDARDLDGAEQAIDLGRDRAFVSGADAFTLSAWVRPGAGFTAGSGGVVFSASIDSDGVSTVDSRAQLAVSADLRVSGGARSADDGQLLGIAAAPGILSEEQWSWVTVVTDYAADSMALYVDGAPVALFAGLGLDPAAPEGPSTNAAVGAQDDLSAGFFLGAIDEVRLSLQARDAARIAAEYRAMTGALASLGEREAL